MDYLKKLIESRVNELYVSIKHNAVTIQTLKENNEELKQLGETLNNYDFLNRVIQSSLICDDCDCAIEEKRDVTICMDCYEAKDVS